MEINKAKTEQGICITIRGSLSGTQNSTVKLFESVSVEIEKDHKQIMLDIENVSYIDSMSIGLLVGVLLKCKERGKDFKFKSVPEHIKNALDSVNLKLIFPELY